MTTQEILDGLKRKDPSTFSHLYKTYGAMIMGHVRKNSGSEEDSHELVQLTMVKLWLSVAEDRYADVGKLGHYVFQIAANSWREELRRRRNRPEEELDTSFLKLEDRTADDLAELAVKDRYLNALHQGLAQMQAPCKDIIQMYHFDKIALQDIAERLAYDYNNLRKKIFDCRKKLKTMVEHIVASS